MEAKQVLNGSPADYPARIRQLRERHGLTQVRLAELLGVSFATVNRWENGQSRPSPLAWQRIVQAEEQGLDGLVDGAEPPRRSQIGESAARYEVADEADLDFTSDPEQVRVVAEGERLSYGHLFNPAFATETSRIDALPHQRIAVYQEMLFQPRLRFLLADDAGAGKTIMAGLYVRETLTRRLLRRVLIVPPAGLVGNWERELRALFSLPFRILTGPDMRVANPFVGPSSNLVIVSVDTLAGERAFARLQDPAVEPYDLVVFDEAHKLAADRDADLTFRPTERYRLAEALAGIPSDDPRWQLAWGAHHLLLLTATPHMGKDYPYYCLWRLLEPEVLSTIDAFNSYPPDARRRHFLRRTKEEMVYFDGRSIYPTRESTTLSYDLSPGEQRLYDETTRYLKGYYNQARFLNQQAARLARNVFQRRLASSTYALLRSFERRREKLDRLIEGIASGRISRDELVARQRATARLSDVFGTKTADEEEAVDGQEENEAAEDRLLDLVVATSLADLEIERGQVRELIALARSVEDAAEESKFAELRAMLQADRFKGEKLILFTEHRDTLDFLVRRLEGLGFAGRIARIHGGMRYQEREEQVAFFRRTAAEGGATYLVATDAAGEGINLQFCWLMVNYDIPWNPARLEQRMGRIHRYGQPRDLVAVVNLVAGKTREGRVLHVLLQKLERIRRELGSDKVFDVIGRLFRGLSLSDYLDRLVVEDDAARAVREVDAALTVQKVRQIAAEERRQYGQGSDVRERLPGLKQEMEREELRRLLPGYVRGFLTKAAPLVDVGMEGDLEGYFSLVPLAPGALDPLWPVLETYPSEARDRLTFYKPPKDEPAVFLHPGEPFFDHFRAHVCARFARAAQKGAVFVDPTAERPYLFHLAEVAVVRQSDPAVPALHSEEVLDYRLVGLRQDEGGEIETCPVEHLLLLWPHPPAPSPPAVERGSPTPTAVGPAPLSSSAGEGWGARPVPPEAIPLAAVARRGREEARSYAAERVARQIAEERRQRLLAGLAEREEFVRRGFDYQDAELALRRSKLAAKVQGGDAHAKGLVTRIREQQRGLEARREDALRAIRREPELIAPGEVRFLAHALVVPSRDPEDRKRQDAAVEGIAVELARAHEIGLGAMVQDVQTPELARQAGLTDRPGFDLLSRRPHGEERAIEVKGRAGVGDVELTENEWAKACNLRDRYWLYVAYDCAGPRPRLLRVRDPFAQLIVRARGGVLIDERAILEVAETGET